MRLSQLFTKTRKDAPHDEVSRNAQLLIKAGYIYKDAAGSYAMLPLGLKVMNRIEQIVRTEMDALGGQELQMTSLQHKDLWEVTDRWNDQMVDIWFKSQLKNGTEVGLAWSHEEPLVAMMREYVSSYRDLPRYVYQFQTKLRNETRAKSGIMRLREFLMKDMYSFSRSPQEHEEFYNQVKNSYMRIFDQLGLGDWTYYTFASGGAFTQFSHEFQTLTEAGEDTIYLHRGKQLAVNKEVLTDEVLKQLDLRRDDLEEVTAAEVGNIFNFGTKKSEQLGLRFTDEGGKVQPVHLGSYGIGIHRVMGVIVERYADDKGLVWPAAVAPAGVHLVRLGDDAAVVKAADKLYDELTAAGKDVLYDDRDVSAGAKFADADLIGVPVRLVVSAKTLEQKAVELKQRTGSESKLVPLAEIIGSV